MKVFWRVITKEAAGTLVESGKVEEVTLPPETIGELEAGLRGSALFLPQSSRKFQEWDVGLLERYEEK